MVDIEKVERDALELYAREQLKKLGFTENQLQELEKNHEIISVYGKILLDRT